MKKLKKIKVKRLTQGSRRRGVLRGSKESRQGILGLYSEVCPFVKRFPYGDLGFLWGGPEKGRERERSWCFPHHNCSVSPVISKVFSPLRGHMDYPEPR